MFSSRCPCVFVESQARVRKMAAVMALGLRGMFTRSNFVARTGLPTILLLRLGYVVSDEIFSSSDKLIGSSRKFWSPILSKQRIGLLWCHYNNPPQLHEHQKWCERTGCEKWPLRNKLLAIIIGAWKVVVGSGAILWREAVISWDVIRCDDTMRIVGVVSHKWLALPQK